VTCGQQPSCGLCAGALWCNAQLPARGVFCTVLVVRRKSHIAACAAAARLRRGDVPRRAGAALSPASRRHVAGGRARCVQSWPTAPTPRDASAQSWWWPAQFIGASRLLHVRKRAAWLRAGRLRIRARRCKHQKTRVRKRTPSLNTAQLPVFFASRRSLGAHVNAQTSVRVHTAASVDALTWLASACLSIPKPVDSGWPQAAIGIASTAIRQHGSADVAQWPARHSCESNAVLCA
jgi:hypothetical protein